MNNHTNHPAVWDHQLGAYVYKGESYSGPSTKKNERIASAYSLEHYKVRQLELIAQALEGLAQALEGQKVVNDLMRKQLSIQNYRTEYFAE